MNGYNKGIKPSVHVGHSFSVISFSNCFLIAYQPISVISYVRMVTLVGRLLAPTTKDSAVPASGGMCRRQEERGTRALAVRMTPQMSANSEGEKFAKSTNRGNGKYRRLEA